MPDLFQCSVVLLAAGGSRRMGQPKQLLPVHGKPLVRHVAEAVMAAPVSSVIVVIGAEAEQVRPALDDLPVHLIVNSAWRDGLSSSLRMGVEAAITQSPDLQAVIICLADQPDLPSWHLQQMIVRFEKEDCTAVASLAGGNLVPPLLFHRSWFAKLCTIQGDIGARALLREHPEGVATVTLGSNTDLDTPEDYARFTS